MPMAFVKRDLVSDGDYPKCCNRYVPKEIWNRYKMRVIGFISEDPAAEFNLLLQHPLEKRKMLLVNSKDFDFTGEK